jgi:ribose transport system permease protein
MIYGAARYAFKTVIAFPPPSASAFLFIGQGRLFGLPMPILLFSCAIVFVHLLLARTSVGRFIYARGDNAETARLTGVRVRTDIMISYLLSALIAFIAGIVSSSSTASMDMQIIDSTMIFDVVLVVVLGGVSLVGGRGGVASVVAGTALIGTLLNGLTIMNINNEMQDIVRGLVLLGAIVLDNRLHPRDEETARQGD